MTREEFVRSRSWILKVIRDRCELTRAETDYLNDLIEVLEQQPCEDCISRENLLKAFKDECRGECDNCPNFRKVDGEYKCRLIADLPSVTQKEKTGKWIYTGNYITDGMLKCSRCGYEHDVADRFLYCPNCGIKMIEPQERSDKE